MKLRTDRIVNFSETFFGVFLFCFFFVQATFLLGNENKIGRGERIAPLITDTTLALAYVNLDQIDVDKFFQKNFIGIDKSMKIFGFDPTSEKRITDEFLRLLEKIKTEFKSQLDKLKDAVNTREAYFLVRIGELDKLKNSVKLSFVFAVPSDKRVEEDRQEFRLLIDQLGKKAADAGFSLSWATGQYHGFEVAVLELDWGLPTTLVPKQPVPVVVEEEDEVSPNDELVDGNELAAREKNWIRNVFSRQNKNAAELVKESFKKHKENAPVRIVFFNVKNIFLLLEHIIPQPQPPSEDVVKTEIDQLYKQTKNVLKHYEKLKWQSMIINAESLMFECDVQMRSESDTKLLFESLVELNNVYGDFVAAAFAKTMRPSDSKFQPLMAEIIKGFYCMNNPVLCGDRLEWNQRDCDLHKLACAGYCIYVYVFLAIFDH
ncbi:MAG: hypothetical protein LBT09_15800 [Planctomycetaceae bacterium]|nr:hypothetical protein [Planctomycetaceae bacterium]